MEADAREFKRAFYANLVDQPLEPDDPRYVPFYEDARTAGSSSWWTWRTTSTCRRRSTCPTSSWPWPGPSATRSWRRACCRPAPPEALRDLSVSLGRLAAAKRRGGAEDEAAALDAEREAVERRLPDGGAAAPAS